MSVGTTDVSTRFAEREPRRRRVSDRVATAASTAAVVLALLPLAVLLVVVTGRALAAVGSGVALGAMADGVLASSGLVARAALVAVPLGVAGGLYLAERKASPLARTMRACADVLAGIPTILVGLAVYVGAGPTGRASQLAGALALGLVMLPRVARSTDTSARAVPDALREAALALGAPRHRILLHVVLRTAAPRIRAGILKAIARASAETAPLLFAGYNVVGGSSAGAATSLQVEIFRLATSGDTHVHGQAWASGFVLLALVLGLNLAARRALRSSEP